MRRISKLFLVALVAASFVMVAGSAFAQDQLKELYGKHGGAKPKISGNAGYAFGFWTIEGLGNTTADDVDGFVTMLEANIVFTGGNGPLDYRWRMRMRGRDRPEAFGDAGIFSGGASLNTLRGYVRWNVSDTFQIKIAKVAVSETTSTTENDPIQNLPCACFVADLFDRGVIDFKFAVGANTFGVTLSGETPSAMSTTGAATGRAGSGGQAPTENLSITGYAKLKLGGLALAGSLITASGTTYDTIFDPTDPNFDPATSGKTGESFDAVGVRVHVGIPIGVGTLKVDVENAVSDLAAGGEMTQLYTGVLLIVGGLRVGFGTNTREVEASAGAPTVEDTQTNITGHYRIPMGKGGWVGPEISLQTIEVDGAEDEDITSIRWLMRIGF